MRVDPLGPKLGFQRPGLPFWFGVADSKAVVFALPGNPVSTLVCLTRYVLPALFAAMAEAPRAVQKIALSAPVTLPPAAVNAFVNSFTLAPAK